MITCDCGLKLRARFRGEVKRGQTVQVRCRCERVHRYTATITDELRATLDAIQRALEEEPTP